MPEAARIVLPRAPDGLVPPVPADAGRLRGLLAESMALGVPRDYARRHRLRRVREPQRLAFAGLDIQARPIWLVPRAARAWLALRRAAAGDLIELHAVSAFRSVEYQLGLIRRKLERGLGIDEILRVSAAPGYSEHHSGRALDLTTPGFAPLEEEFERSAAFAWLMRHAGAFEFRLSYPCGNPHAIAYEPWHWCWHPAPRA